MRLFHVELEREPPLKVELHPRLTVVAADAPTRALVVDAFDTLLRGRAAGLRGALVAEGARADFVVESTTGPVLPGVPTIVRAADIDAAPSDAGASAVERAQQRHAEALEALRAAEAALVQEQAIVAAYGNGGGDARIAPDGSGEPDAVRRSLRAYVAELQEALQAPALPDQRRVQLLERGTVLAADAARLGVCRPASVRALLDAVDAFNVTPASGGAPVATLVREVVLDLDVANGAARTVALDSTAVERARQQLDVREREVGEARSRALAVFAELESLRRAAATTERNENGGAFATALRARLSRPMPTSWVGPTPIVVDDALAKCPAEDVDSARSALVDAAERTQVVYITDDADALAWAQRLPADLGALTRPSTR